LFETNKNINVPNDPYFSVFDELGDSLDELGEVSKYREMLTGVSSRCADHQKQNL